MPSGKGFGIFRLEDFINISNKSTRTSIQIQLYTIANKKNKSCIYLKGEVKGEERIGMAYLCPLYIILHVLTNILFKNYG